jgi:hypothetical protein
LISDITLGQLEGLTFTGRPLVICDVDEVIVHFTRDFERLLAQENLWLDTASFALNGNVRCRDTGEPAGNHQVGELITRFFDEQGRPVRVEDDYDFDGRVDLVASYREGELASDVLDTNFDGRTDVWRDYRAGQMHELRRDATEVSRLFNTIIHNAFHSIGFDCRLKVSLSPIII